MKINRRKRMRASLIITMILLVALTIRLATISLVTGAVSGHDLKEEAYVRQVRSEIISPKRGMILDATGDKVLAMSSTVETISINPTEIVKSEDKEKLARAFSEIFALDYNETFSKVNSDSELAVIARKVEKEKTDRLKEWMDENNFYTGINIDEDSKRYYPYGNLASNLIGFCGTDGQGIDGLEYSFDDILKGNEGKTTTTMNSVGQEIPDADKKQVSEENGSNVILTIDANIQSLAEEKLKQACLDNKCLNGGNIIVMNPQNGDIMAMATYPDYDLNNPFVPTDETLSAAFVEASEEGQNAILSKMWRNKAVVDTYEPGSTFKVIDTAIALEENLFGTDHIGDLNCIGYQEVADRRITCSRYPSSHGAESLRTALVNSCNPAFIQVVQKIGTETFLKYLKAFGIFEYTGIELPGETSGIPLDKTGPVELATAAIGQRFNITPLQLITAISAIANDGELMKPRVVKQIVNPDTNAVTNVEPVAVRQVVSEETARSVKDMMVSFVDNTKAAQVAGYEVGGKTGTAQAGTVSGRYYSSFVGIAPVASAEVAILVVLYEPTAGKYYGGEVAAPVGAEILTEILPYLEGV